MSAAALVAVVVSAPKAAVAAYPGENGRIAFYSNSTQENPLWSMNPDGSGMTRLTPDFGGFPSWSPDGTKIAYHGSGSPTNVEVFVMNADGSGRRALTNASAYDGNPTWSPDGSRIAFDTYRDGDPEIYLMNADGSGVTRLTNDPGRATSPAWSPDGSRIAFVSNRTGHSDIFLMSPDGSDQVNVTPDAEWESYPSWSPDGTKIAFDRSGDARSDIYVMGADGSNITRLTNDPADDFDPMWSPDGKLIGFESTRPLNFSNADIWLMNADGSDQRRIPGNRSGDSGAPDWQPLPGYPRPKGATPTRLSLVPAFVPCLSPDRQHGAPLSFGSCSSPSRVSSALTVGTPDANGQGPKSVGSLSMSVVVGDPGTAADEADVRFTVGITDVRRASDLADYSGEVSASVQTRATDGGWRDSATLEDFEFSFAIPCAPTADATVGSACNVATSADAVLGDATAVDEGGRAIWQLGQAHVYDGGADELASTQSDNALFLNQGIFVP